MDTRKVSPAVRRRVGAPVSVYTQAYEGGVVRSTPMGTDWGAIEAAFDVRAQQARDVTVPSETAGA